MSARISIVCDAKRCKAKAEGHFAEQRAAIRARLQRKGWARVGKRDFCPSCTPEGKNAKD